MANENQEVSTNPASSQFLYVDRREERLRTMQDLDRDGVPDQLAGTYGNERWTLQQRDPRTNLYKDVLATDDAALVNNELVKSRDFRVLDNRLNDIAADYVPQFSGHNPDPATQPPTQYQLEYSPRSSFEGELRLALYAAMTAARQREERERVINPDSDATMFAKEVRKEAESAVARMGVPERRADHGYSEAMEDALVMEAEIKFEEQQERSVYGFGNEEYEDTEMLQIDLVTAREAARQARVTPGSQVTDIFAAEQQADYAESLARAADHEGTGLGTYLKSLDQERAYNRELGQALAERLDMPVVADAPGINPEVFKQEYAILGTTTFRLVFEGATPEKAYEQLGQTARELLQEGENHRHWGYLAESDRQAISDAFHSASVNLGDTLPGDIEGGFQEAAAPAWEAQYDDVDTSNDYFEQLAEDRAIAQAEEAGIAQASTDTRDAYDVVGYRAVGVVQFLDADNEPSTREPLPNEEPNAWEVHKVWANGHARSLYHAPERSREAAEMIAAEANKGLEAKGTQLATPPSRFAVSALGEDQVDLDDGPPSSAHYPRDEIAEFGRVLQERERLSASVVARSEAIADAVDLVRNASAGDAEIAAAYERAARDYAQAKHDQREFEAQPSQNTEVVEVYRGLTAIEQRLKAAEQDAAEARTMGDLASETRANEHVAREVQARNTYLANHGVQAATEIPETERNTIERGLSPEQIDKLMKPQQRKEVDQQLETAAPAAKPAPQVAEAQNQVRDLSAFADAQARDKLVPETVAAAYKRDGQKYLDANDPKKVAFVDKGNRLQTIRTFDDKAVEDMVATADARGWSELKVTGDEAFRRKAWVEATARGIEVKGYEPTEKDKLRAEQLGKQNGHANSIEKNETVEAYRNARDGDAGQKKNAAKQHPELIKAFALEQAAKAFASQRLDKDSRDGFVAALRENIERGLAKGNSLPEIRKRQEAERRQDRGVER
ncbi:LPD7 domain-containing protein [Xanthomonas campestris]|uniref:LPD7 domain-containing protein n=1 Tax=Xanthomonas campestris TaxID=339 RepID=UPI0035579469